MPLDEKIEFGEAAQMLTCDEDFKKPDVGNLLRLDLACGQHKKEGFLGVDLHSEQADIKHDLGVFPWPFEDCSVYEIHCSHYVEHVKDLVAFMEEIYRVLMPLGTIRIICPYYTSVRAWQDPTHVRPITEITFDYFDPDKQKMMGVDHYFGKANFEVLHRRYYLNPEWEHRAEEVQMWALRHYFNVCADIEFQLRKRS